jgi:hypothetical protein
LLEEVAVLTTSPRCAAQLGAEFPSIYVRYTDEPAQPHLRASDWEHSGFDTWAFDVSIDALARAPFTLRIADDTARDAFPLEVLNRCQRHIDRRNRHSHGQLFTRVLRKHRSLHDLDKPLVRADYNHALDTWQWLLRLDGEASLPAQLAALFHDIERLASESDARVEHLAGDYQSFKDAHASKGAEMTLAVLAEAGVGESVRERVAQLVAKHERQSGDPEIALLNDADALSFFSLNSPGYANYFGPEQTRRKVADTWNRMRDGARRKLASVRLTTEIRTMLNEATAAA